METKPIEISITGNIEGQGKIMALRLAAALQSLTIARSLDNLTPPDFLDVPQLFVQSFSFKEQPDKYVLRVILQSASNGQEIKSIEVS